MNEDYQKKLDEMLDKIAKKKKTPRLLLHACCAPCSSYVLEYLSKYFEITIYYYNPNIYPFEEFDKRVIELKRLIKEMPLDHKVDIVVENYNNEEFNEAIIGYEKYKEGSQRCFKCYNLRMEKAARYAKDHKYDYFTTTLSISPYKNANKLNEIGESLEKRYKIKYLYADFKKKNGYKRSIELSEKYKLYRQDYCGCDYSKKESIERKKAKEIRSSVETIMTTRNKKKDNSIDFKAKKSDYKGGFSVIRFVLALIIVAGGIVILQNYDKKVKKEPVVIDEHNINSDNLTNIDIDDTLVTKKANLTELYFYGDKFNLNGDLETTGFSVKDVNLILVGDKFKYSYDINFNVTGTGIHFFGSNKMNAGLNLDKVNIDNYLVYLEVELEDKKEYYYIVNDTSYKETEYYTVTYDNFNKKLTFSNKDNKLYLNVIANTDDVYDIIIDPGHGGKDEGACYNKVCEINYTLNLSNMLKKNLEELGYKVKLTRTEDVTLDKYGEDGRIARTYKANAKLLISIHLNSMSIAYNGFEIYTSTNIDYNFARQMVTSLSSISDLSYSNNTSFRVEHGIYTRTFSSSNVKDINNDVKIPYTNISTNTNYYFMIRETGGYMSGAYVDGQEGDGENPYRVSNVGAESYILELGYINNPSNVELINANKEKYMKALADTINKHFKG